MNIIVIGSGVMGAGIAEQIANAGFNVHLLDIILPNQEDRNFLSKQALTKIKPFDLSKIVPGNLEDDIEAIKEADWIIEVIVEKLDIKQTLYAKLEKYCKKDCIISSNTSTIRLDQLIDGRSNYFKENFLITHFFNPPRYMPLLELVTSKFTKEDVIQKISDFIDIHLGKTIVKSYDTPGFIANRIGCYWLEVALSLAIEMGITIEAADGLMSKPIGIPKTGVFGLYDLIGIDVMQLISKSLISSLAEDDNFAKVSLNHPIIEGMIKEALIGRKGKGGFYKINKDTKLKQVIDLKTGEYRDLKEADCQITNIKELIDSNQYALRVLSKTLSYAAGLVNQISDNIYDIDQAMKLGYNWKYGPFELIDMIKPAYFREKLKQQNIAIPKFLEQVGDKKFYHEESYFTGINYASIPRPKDIIYLKDFKNIIYQNNSAKVLDIGDEIAVIEFTSKMGIADHELFNLIIEFFTKYADNFKAVILANNQPNFSVGGDLKFMLDNANNLELVDQYLKLGQQAMLAIKYSKIPVIASLKGMALGGGSELLLHSSGVAAHIETNSGLVETGIGLIPGWGGCKELILRAKTEVELIDAFRMIMDGKISSSAHELQEMFRFDTFKTSMNVNRILADSKILAMKLKKQDKNIIRSIKVSLEEVILEYSGYDQVIAKELASIFELDNRTEQELLDQERKVFLKLLGNKLTQDRISYMLKKGKRLKN